MSDPQAPTDFQDATIVVLGASGGIGSALCKRLHQRGAKLVLAARDQDRLNELAEEVGGESVPTDATDPDAVEALCERAAEIGGGRIDGLVNGVGSVFLKPAHLTEPEDWRSVISVNLDTAFHAVRSGAKRMMKSGGGSIVLMSSVAARLGLINHEAIAAAKGGVQGLMLASAASYAPKGVRVNCVAPGLTRTNATEMIFKNETSLNASVAMHPIRRPGEPDDVAAAIEWLLDPGQSWVTGQIIGVDGGLGTVKARGGS